MTPWSALTGLMEVIYHLRSGANIEFHMRRTKLQFGSTQMGKARPLGQTWNMIRRTKFSHNCFDIEAKIYTVVIKQIINLLLKFDSLKDRRLYHSRSSHVLSV